MIKDNIQLIEETKKNIQDKIPEEVVIHIAKQLGKYC